MNMDGNKITRGQHTLTTKQRKKKLAEQKTESHLRFFVVVEG